MGRDGSKAEWDKNRLGPFTVLRRHAGSTAGDGRLYTATRSESAPPGLVVVPVASGHFLPRGSWSLRASASTKPGFLALELERAPDCRAPLSEVAEGLDVLANALERLERDPDAAAHLLGAPISRRRPPPRARHRYPTAWAVGMAAALTLLLWPLRVEHAPRHEGMRTTPDGPVATGLGDAAVQVPAVAVDGRMAWKSVALDLPKKPFEGQYRPPCREGVEVELRTKDGTKACWIEVRVDAGKCRENGYEHGGKCYLPSIQTQRRPAAVTP
ncbi:hypothetical protein [Stigmatella erecta]|uniref:Uncharacterized protein n=1 Tax=Stigmatella erecta TaxID=83460 RepID=A0A1I0LA87_9BACT|nr:hypothetical protein [Stigmatella erecta]SEU36984.1 hypothetical protein SAMN05443639_12329 [Stigmatella erecta]